MQTSNGSKSEIPVHWSAFDSLSETGGSLSSLRRMFTGGQLRRSEFSSCGLPGRS